MTARSTLHAPVLPVDQDLLAAGRTRADEDKLVRQHAELVRRIAHHLAARLPPSVDVDDLIQAGVIGLIEAARNYHPEGGASFETFAGIRIRGAMLDELRQGDWAPRSLHRRMRDIGEAMRRIEQRSGREAQESEVADALGLSIEDYRSALADASRTHMLRLDGAGENGDETLDVAAPEAGALDQLEHEAFRDALVTAIDQLPERERQVMALYYDEELNLREIGAVLGVSESRVCQLHGQALSRLRGKLDHWREVALAA